MYIRIRGAIVAALVTGVLWGCGGDSRTPSLAPEAEDRAATPPGKLALSEARTLAVLNARVMRGQTPVSGVSVEIGRAVSGRTAAYEWSGTTNVRGQARIGIAGDRVTGYYRARATRDGIALGSWSSIPVNGGYETTVELVIGGRASTGATIRLAQGGLPAEIAMGVVLPLTGPQTRYGFPARDAFELAREEINNASKLGGASINFILEDSRGTAEGAVEAFNRLIDRDGVQVILGPVISTAAREAFPIAQRKEVIAFSSTSTAAGLSAIGDYVFRSGLNVNALIPGPVRVTQEKLRYRRVATIVDVTDVFSSSSDESIRNTLAGIDVEVLTRETIATGDTTFSEQLTRIKALNPHAVFVSALGAEQSRILIQAREAGIGANIPFLVPVMTAAEVEAAGDAAEGAISFLSWSGAAGTPGNAAFVANYLERYGSEPNTWAAQSYAALYILAEAISEAGSTDAGAIRDAMAATRDLDTVLGAFSFDNSGDAVYDPVVLIVRDGELAVFE
ncbi:MAG: ABC transporter substrate-binding protein [Gemmatimonadota bacterium]|nr:ABC transporter substrate-binding protein [Gemmatimonadota bacterium]